MERKKQKSKRRKGREKRSTTGSLVMSTWDMSEAGLISPVTDAEALSNRAPLDKAKSHVNVDKLNMVREVFISSPSEDCPYQRWLCWRIILMEEQVVYLRCWRNYPIDLEASYHSNLCPRKTSDSCWSALQATKKSLYHTITGLQYQYISRFHKISIFLV